MRVSIVLHPPPYLELADFNFFQSGGCLFTFELLISWNIDHNLSFLAFRLFLLWIAYSFFDPFFYWACLWVINLYEFILYYAWKFFDICVASIFSWSVTCLFTIFVVSFEIRFQTFFFFFSFKLYVVRFIQLFFVICNFYVLI